VRLPSAVGRLARPANRLITSVRRVARPAARLPLRVRLVAAVGILLTAALVLISVASAVELRSYLIQRTDDEITAFAYRLNASGLPSTAVQRVLPSDYVVAVVPPFGTGAFYADESLSKEELPDLAAIVSAAGAHLDVPYTVSAQNGRSRWRMFVTVKANGQILIVGERLHNVDDAVDRLIATELLVGLSALVLLTTVGVMIVRSSLAPLLEIERTAGAIARGDLAQRVPESDPETEVGRLAQALRKKKIEK